MMNVELLVTGPSRSSPNCVAEIVPFPPILSFLPSRKSIVRTDESLSPFKTENPPVEKVVPSTKSRLI